MGIVDLVFISADQETVYYRIPLSEGLKLADAIKQSGIWTTHPETKDLTVGLYSKPVPLDTVLKAGDRIEFYRPLLSCPKEKRRKRAR